MMITRESDYAIRIIRALRGGEQLTIEEICRVERVPRQFAYKILKKLEKAGLVSIRRGAGGGCTLGRSLGELTLLDVIQAADPEFILNPCLAGGYRCEYVNRDGAGEKSMAADAGIAADGSTAADVDIAADADIVADAGIASDADIASDTDIASDGSTAADRRKTGDNALVVCRTCTVHCELARIQTILEQELRRTTLDRLFIETDG